MSYSGYGRYLLRTEGQEAADRYEYEESVREDQETSFEFIASERSWLTVDAVADDFRYEGIV